MPPVFALPEATLFEIAVYINWAELKGMPWSFVVSTSVTKEMIEVKQNIHNQTTNSSLPN
jgi:hypothetical protein